MGRAGGGGGHHSSGGGHHSGGHSSGGHSVGHRSVRAGSGRHGAGAGHGGHRSSIHYSHSHYRRFGTNPYELSRPVGSNSFNIVIFIVLWVILGIVCQNIISAKYAVRSTIERTKLETSNSFINDCIIDEVGWFDNISKTESLLKSFWEETGIQPFIILKDYDDSLNTEAEKEQWAVEYYESNFINENIFLYVYFAEKDVDNDVGYMCYVNGYQTSSVMDTEAIEIFWAYIDRYWYTNLSTDDMFVKVFDSTADTIMQVSTTSKDILKVIIEFLVVGVLGAAICTVVYLKAKRKREVAEEKWRILNTPLETLVNDELKNKYL